MVTVWDTQTELRLYAYLIICKNIIIYTLHGGVVVTVWDTQIELRLYAYLIVNEIL